MKTNCFLLAERYICAQCLATGVEWFWQGYDIR